MADKKNMLSGIKPTGRPHIGNYFGAMRQFVELQNSYETSIFIADYHALTTLHNPEELTGNTFSVALDYLAIGLDPEKVVLFRQSAVPQTTELAWIFSCITTVAYLQRAHAYKDAEAKGKEVGVGTFEYPLLMAADILLHDAEVVPVGEDQKQHLEIARDTARKFNHLFGETFKEPQARLLKEVALVPGIDGKKMSKSYNNTIPLFASEEETKKRVMSIVTDSKGENEQKDSGSDNIFALHRLFLADEPLAVLQKRYHAGEIGYRESKEMLADEINKYFAPMRARRRELEKNSERVKDILKRGEEKARTRAETKMADIRKKIGIIP